MVTMMIWMVTILVDMDVDDKNDMNGDDDDMMV